MPEPDEAVFKRFCEAYPEYCSRSLFIKLFGGLVPVSEVLSSAEGTVVSFKGVVVGREVRRTKREGLYGFTIQVCDKDACASVSGVAEEGELDSIPSEGHEVLVKGRIKKWRGNSEVSVLDLKVLSDVREALKTADAGVRSGGDAGGKGEAAPRQGAGKGAASQQGGERKPIEILLGALSEAQARGQEVMKEKAEKLARRLGLSWAEVEPHVEVYAKDVGGQRVEYVRVRRSGQ